MWRDCRWALSTKGLHIADDIRNNGESSCTFAAAREFDPHRLAGGCFREPRVACGDWKVLVNMRIHMAPDETIGEIRAKNNEFLSRNIAQSERQHHNNRNKVIREQFLEYEMGRRQCPSPLPPPPMGYYFMAG